jgi:regulator of ribonuclease activity A
MELSELSIGIWAISTHPRRSEKLGAGVRDVPVDMAGVVVRPGNWCFADPDGLVVSDRKLDCSG